jgi:hypothetical protein
MAGIMSSGRYPKGKRFSHRSGHLMSSPSTLVRRVQTRSHIFIAESTCPSNLLHKIFKVGAALILG